VRGDDDGDDVGSARSNRVKRLGHRPTAHPVVDHDLAGSDDHPARAFGADEDRAGRARR
jgi:hypothetical protein